MGIVRIIGAALVAVILAASAPPAQAAEIIGTEWWLGGGFYNPDYNDRALAVIRGGGGLLVLERFTLGANLQGDSDRWFGMGYAGVILPGIFSIEPYGRFHAGRRDDVSDTVLGWTGGLRYGAMAIKLYVEAFGVIEPGYGTGICVGFSF